MSGHAPNAAPRSVTSSPSQTPPSMATAATATTTTTTSTSTTTSASTSTPVTATATATPPAATAIATPVPAATATVAVAVATPTAARPSISGTNTNALASTAASTLTTNNTSSTSSTSNTPAKKKRKTRTPSSASTSTSSSPAAPKARARAAAASVPATECEDDLNLFRATGLRHPEYWQCIRFIAPTPEKKKWKSADSVGVFCIECKCRIPYDSFRNSKAVKRHMIKLHKGLLEAYVPPPASSTPSASAKKASAASQSGGASTPVGLVNQPPALANASVQQPPASNAAAGTNVDSYGNAVSTHAQAHAQSYATAVATPTVPPASMGMAVQANDASNTTWLLGANADGGGCRSAGMDLHPPTPTAGTAPLPNDVGNSNGSAKNGTPAGYSRKKKQRLQSQFNSLVVRWVVETLQPSHPVCSKQFQDILNFAFYHGKAGSLYAPSQPVIRNTLTQQADALEQHILDQIHHHCEYYSITANLWTSSRSGRTFMPLTLRFLTEEFDSRTYVLDVLPVHNNDAAVSDDTKDIDDDNNRLAIRSQIQQTLQHWGLKESMMAVLVHDSATTINRNCEDWEVTSPDRTFQLATFPAIDHALHLVVGPLLFDRRQHDIGGATPDRLDSYIDEFNSSFFSHSVVQEMRNVISDMHRYARYLAAADDIPQLRPLQTALKAKFNDSATSGSGAAKSNDGQQVQWKTTFATMKIIVPHIPTIIDVHSHGSTSADETAIKNDARDSDDANALPSWLPVPEVSIEHWALLEGLRYLLTSFDKASRMMVQQQQQSQHAQTNATAATATTATTVETTPTTPIASVLPVLYKLKQYISNASMFHFTSQQTTVPASTSMKQTFIERYSYCTFYTEVLERLETCRSVLVQEYEQQIHHVIQKHDWMVMLDPKFVRMASTISSTDPVASLQKEVEELVRRTHPAANVAPAATGGGQQGTGQSKADDDDDNMDDDDDEHDFSFDDLIADNANDGNDLSPEATTNQHYERLNKMIEQEIQSYQLSATTSMYGNSANAWWKQQRFKYTYLTTVARKWLCASGISAACIEKRDHQQSICDLMEAHALDETSSLMKKQILLYCNGER